MLGVLANPGEDSIVREFFELFKTPWEPYSPGRSYNVVLCATDAPPPGAARLLIHYYGQRTSADDARHIRSCEAPRNASLTHRGTRLRLYGNCVTFLDGDALPCLQDGGNGYCSLTQRSSESVRVRVGYDLFVETGILLTTGQPSAEAECPTLDLHIAFLRELIIGNGVPLVEIPPSPAGYDYAVCLTHDVDHPSLRFHRWDHTTLGFLYRATIASAINLTRGRLSLAELVKNWSAALSLPLIHLGLANDIWLTFDRYLELESGLGSTFFIIPRSNDPGRNPGKSPRRRRSSAYGAADIRKEILRLSKAGCEIGLHGIDAWLTRGDAVGERDTIARTTGSPPSGVRMHWLFFARSSAAELDSAGFLYDSTLGYNDTVGFRAGTTQVFRPLDSRELLELPLHIMDTALFYPAYLNLRQDAAFRRVKEIVRHAMQHGGAVTINWHDRSLAPERLWGPFYEKLIEFLKTTRAWFPTASQAIHWFKRRRSVRLEVRPSTSGPDGFQLSVNVPEREDLPPLKLHIYNAEPVDAAAASAYGPATKALEIVVKKDLEVQLTANSRACGLIA